MSFEVPENVGELSHWALERAIDKVDRALADAPEDVRAAIAVIRLDAEIGRREPWYGVQVNGEDGASVSTVMRNLVEFYWGSESYRERVKRRLEAGKREYVDFLTRLRDPLGYQQRRWRRLSDEKAAVRLRAVDDYLDRKEP